MSRILSSVTSSLSADARRRFVWAETSFFMRWYETQPVAVQASVRALVRAGQLEFVGGGWVQNDEANPDFATTVAQMTEGHELLQTLFGVRPRIAVQFDPFGHAAQTAAIAALAGYSAIVLNRIDYSLKDALKARAALEFVWRPYAGSPAARCAGAHEPGCAGGSGGGSGGEDDAELASYANASIFAHVLHTHYSAPKGYDFENPEGYAVSEGNVRSRAEALAEELRRRAAAYRSSHLLVPFGDDFKFQNAEVRGGEPGGARSTERRRRRGRHHPPPPPLSLFPLLLLRSTNTPTWTA